MKNKFLLVVMIILVDGYINAKELIFFNLLQGNDALIQDDLFLSTIGLFDKQIALQSDKINSESEYIDYVSDQALDWTTLEQDFLSSTFSELVYELKKYGMHIPNVIILIKTTGNENWHLPYCRGKNIIVFPKARLLELDIRTKRTFAHELFHIYSRNNEVMQNLLYEKIGFYKLETSLVESSFLDKVIINPDYIRYDYYFNAEIKGETIKVIPLIVRNSEFLLKKKRQLEFYKMNIFIPANSMVKDNIFYYPRDINNLYQIAGSESKRFIQPEEILAKYFEKILLNEILEKDIDIINSLIEVLMLNLTTAST